MFDIIHTLHFQGDLTDTSAKTARLLTWAHFYISFVLKTRSPPEHSSYAIQPSDHTSTFRRSASLPISGAAYAAVHCVTNRLEYAVTCITARFESCNRCSTRLSISIMSGVADSSPVAVQSHVQSHSRELLRLIHRSGQTGNFSGS